MSPRHYEVTPIDLSDARERSEAATVATRAFQFDPFFVYLSDRPLLRARGLGLFCRSQMAAMAGHCEAFAARRDDGRLLGVAIWLPPGRYPLPVATQLHQSVGAAWALCPVPLALVRGTQYLLAIDKVHPKEPLWYLALLVADPAAQRSGIGTALQAEVLERADEEGAAAYLETQNPDNLPYYRRFGYEVVDELRPVRGGPPLWTLRREPRSFAGRRQ